MLGYRIDRLQQQDLVAWRGLLQEIIPHLSPIDGSGWQAALAQSPALWQQRWQQGRYYGVWQRAAQQPGKPVAHGKLAAVLGWQQQWNQPAGSNMVILRSGGMLAALAEDTSSMMLLLELSRQEIMRHTTSMTKTILLRTAPHEAALAAAAAAEGYQHIATSYDPMRATNSQEVKWWALPLYPHAPDQEQLRGWLSQRFDLLAAPDL